MCINNSNGGHHAIRRFLPEESHAGYEIPQNHDGVEILLLASICFFCWLFLNPF